MMIWIAYVHDLYTPFDPTEHCRPEDAGFSMTITQEEGGVAQVLVQRKQVGWAIMHPDAPRCAIISESHTGDPADAVVLARGRIVGIPADLFEATQEITISCSPENLADVANDLDGTPDGPLLAFAKANLTSTPENCWLLDDMNRDDPASYLQGRAVSYHYDPATHEISVSDLAKGPVINMGRSHFHSKKVKPITEWGEMPVSRTRQSVRAGWTQAGAGSCDVAPRIVSAGAHPYISTLNPDFTTNATNDLPNGLVNFSLGGGWTIGDSLMTSTQVSTPYFLTGRDALFLFLITVRYIVQHPDGSQHLQYRDEEAYRTHYERNAYKEWRFRLHHLWMNFEVAQEREEHGTVLVDMPVQTVPGLEKEEELPEVSTVDLISDPRAVPYETGEWTAGDIVEFGGRIFMCNETHVSTSFRMRKPNQVIWDPLNPTVFNVHPYWDEIDRESAIKQSANEFLTTPGGRQVLGHLVLRGRRRLIDRSRALRITLTYPWRLARSITLKHSLRCEVPWYDGTTRAIVGKVVGIEKSLPHRKGATIAVTIAVALGTGDNGVTDKDLATIYGSSSNIFATRYLRQLDDGDDPTEVFGVAGDTEFVVEAEPASRPIDIELLTNPGYAVMRAIRENEANEQLGRAMHRAFAHKDPKYAASELPTRIGVQMRNLTVEGVLQRDVLVAAEVLTSPRGIDLIEGAEP